MMNNRNIKRSKLSLILKLVILLYNIHNNVLFNIPISNSFIIIVKTDRCNGSLNPSFYHSKQKNNKNNNPIRQQQQSTALFNDINNNNNNDDNTIIVNPDVASKFTIKTCSSTSCTKKREKLGLHVNTTYNAFYEQIQHYKSDTTANINNPLQYVQVQESKICLGSCQKSPCVGIEHDDYDGYVSINGMTSYEFTKNVFNTIIDTNDIQRVLVSVENAILQMSNEDNEEDEEE